MAVQREQPRKCIQQHVDDHQHQAKQYRSISSGYHQCLWIGHKYRGQSEYVSVPQCAIQRSGYVLGTTQHLECGCMGQWHTLIPMVFQWINGSWSHKFNAALGSDSIHECRAIFCGREQQPWKCDQCSVFGCCESSRSFTGDYANGSDSRHRGLHLRHSEHHRSG